MEVFSDKDLGSEKPYRNSESGYVFTLYEGGFSWRSKQQIIVAQSYVEAEFAGTLAGSEGNALDSKI